MSRPAMRQLVGEADIWMITLDTLRFDVAQAEHAASRTPHLSCLLGPAGWQRRHSPASFTYAAHHAFFAGFLPTPAEPLPQGDPRAERLMAAEFGGSETTGADTWTTPEATIVEGLAAVGYQTICVGGVGFFNPATALGAVLPALFERSHWSTATSVTDPGSFGNQLDWLENEVWPNLTPDPLFCFINVAAIHQPNAPYLDKTMSKDTVESHAAALRYVDRCLPQLLQLIQQRNDQVGRPTLLLLMSDHGTCYGEDGFNGHRLAHEVTWTVPYAEVWLP